MANMTEAIDLLREAKEAIESVTEEEGEAFENLPEGIQESDRGDTMQENITTMENVTESIDTQLAEIEDCILSLTDI